MSIFSVCCLLQLLPPPLSHPCSLTLSLSFSYSYSCLPSDGGREQECIEEYVVVKNMNGKSKYIHTHIYIHIYTVAHRMWKMLSHILLMNFRKLIQILHFRNTQPFCCINFWYTPKPLRCHAHHQMEIERVTSKIFMAELAKLHD